MENLLFVMCWIKDHHVMSLTFGVLSAILWIKSATAKVELGKKIVMVTYEDPELNGKRKLTAVCSHQTRIGNLDAHLI
ncbi:hypothetical protein OFP06_23140 [Escherichia coli]|nr:hypothetical protein [Escherichia coli]MCV4510188.1 hypothetical protein [Escherichia coli]MCV4660929.1 hypothetical protein [Escherichia coli]MCV4676067.1 hypothetical protein [Escherichia coli]MCV4696115.1 hypothetical protein [Escherichia coli]